MDIIRRHFTLIAIITIVILSCGLGSITLYLIPTNPIYPNAYIANEGEHTCEVNRGFGCLRATTFYTADSSQTVKTQLAQSGIHIHYGQGTNFAVLSNTHYSLKLEFLGLDNLNFSRVHYLYLYDEQNQTRLTQTVYTTLALHK